MSVDPDINEREALDALLLSDGWTMFIAHIEEEWGAVAYARKIDAAIATAKQSGMPAEGEICELGAAARAARLAAQYPTQRLGELQGAKPKAGMFAAMRRA